MLHVTDLRKSYGTRRVLRGVTFSAAPGQVVAIVGPNGSGKSTLLKIVAGLLRPSGGTVALSGPGVGGNAEDANVRRALCGYAAPDLALYPELSGTENLRFFDIVGGRTRRTAEEYDALLTGVGLTNRGSDRVAQYSSGMRQRLRLAFAQLKGHADAPLLLLDEPTLALDESGVALVARVIESHVAHNGITLLATNDARETAWADVSVSVVG